MNVAIYKTHFGGEYDAINVIRMPIITAVISIVMDYKLLGPIIEKVAWHKAEIFKSGSITFSTFQLFRNWTLL